MRAGERNWPSSLKSALGAYKLAGRYHSHALISRVSICHYFKAEKAITIALEGLQNMHYISIRYILYNPAVVRRNIWHEYLYKYMYLEFTLHRPKGYLHSTQVLVLGS